MANRPRPNRKTGKMIQTFPDFSGGLNTAGAVHQVADNEFVEGVNIDIGEQGSVSKRKGNTRIGESLGATPVQGLYAFHRGHVKEMLAVHNGRLYKFVVEDVENRSLLGNGRWEEIVVRLPSPSGVTLSNHADNAGSNLSGNTEYKYSVVAKRGTGRTPASVEGTHKTASTAKKIVVKWNRIFGAEAYEIYRNGKLIHTVLPVDDEEDENNGKLLGEWIDDGSKAPGNQDPPTENTTTFTMSASNRISFVNYNDRCVIASGHGIVIYDGEKANIAQPYTPSKAELESPGINAYEDPDGDVHKCTRVAVHGEHVFFTGNPLKPQNFYWSDLGLSSAAPQLYVPAIYSADVTTGNGHPITGMANFRDVLVFFTRGSIHALFGRQPMEGIPEPFVLRTIHHDIGCESPESIRLVGNALMFVSEEGIYALTNVVASNTYMNIQLISAKIEPTLKKIDGKNLAVAVFHDQQYKICFPEAGVVLRYYPLRSAWTIDDGPLVNAYALWEDQLYMASYTDGHVLKHGFKLEGDREVESYSDNGKEIAFYLKTKSFDMGTLLNEKKARKIYIVARQYEARSSVEVTITMEYTRETEFFELNENSAVLGKWILGENILGWKDVLTIPMKFRAKGRQISFEFKNDFNNEPCTIYACGVQFKTKRVK